MSEPSDRPSPGPRKRGRAVPPAEPVPVIYGPLPNASNAYKHAVAADSQRFLETPGLAQFEREMIPGEVPGTWPPGTRVLVGRVGGQVVRAFFPPSAESN